jgi:hypothetical protein
MTAEDEYRRSLINQLRSVLLHAPLCKAAAQEIEDLMDENEWLLRELRNVFRPMPEKERD